jgi:hypothetical protein
LQATLSALRDPHDGLPPCRPTRAALRHAKYSSRPRSARFLIWLMAYLIGLWWDPQSIPSITGARWANTRNKTALASQIRATVLHIRHTPLDCGPQRGPSNLTVCYDGLLTTSFSRSERGQPARGRPVRGHPERAAVGRFPLERPPDWLLSGWEVFDGYGKARLQRSRVPPTPPQ